MSTTLRRNANPDQPAEGQPPEAEALMRRALGLLPSGSPRPRARGGDGPVVEHRGDRQPGSSINRVAAAEAALVEARQAREQLTRQLRDAETALREAQTKRGHAELARDELLTALAVERSAREAAEERVRILSATTQTQAGDLAAAGAHATVARATRQDTAVQDTDAPRKRRGRPPGSGAKNKPPANPPEPESETDGAVEWWVPGWQERT